MSALLDRERRCSQKTYGVCDKFVVAPVGFCEGISLQNVLDEALGSRERARSNSHDLMVDLRLVSAERSKSQRNCQRSGCGQGERGMART